VLLGNIFLFHNKHLLNKQALLVANRVSHVDATFLFILFDYTMVVKGDSGNQRDLLKFIRLAENNEVCEKELKEVLDNPSITAVVFPEDFATDGKVLLPFREWPFKLNVRIQPISIEVIRPFCITTSLLTSCWWSDLLWSFFCPFTIYQIKMDPDIMKQADQTTEQFIEKARRTIARKLTVECVDFTNDEINNFIMDKNGKERARRTMTSSAFAQQVAMVKEVLPNVPSDVIERDLRRTKCVDNTIVNFMEGIVTYKPVVEQKKEMKKKVTVRKTQQPPPSSSTAAARKPKFDWNQLKTFESRKLKFLEDARQRYVVKHQQAT